MNKNGYTITRSNYTIRKKHKTLSNGSTIYERDFMTTTNLSDYGSSVFPINKTNFKFVYNTKDDKTRAHKYGDYIPSKDGDIYWTLKDTQSQINVNKESDKELKQITPNPNKDTLSEFAYYGSAVELIRSSVTDIINKFPGEMYTKGPIKDNVAGFGYPLILENPFDIDVLTLSLSSNEENTVNKRRYFCESFKDYKLLIKNPAGRLTTTNIVSWEVVPNEVCLDPGVLGSYAIIKSKTENGNKEHTIKIGKYNYNGKIILIASNNGTKFEYLTYRIRPKDEYLQDFHDELDDFEKYMLNKVYKPQNTMILETPVETEDGFLVKKQRYTWPTDGWNLDIKVSENGGEVTPFEDYYNRLIEVAKFYDSNKTNNLLKNIVHDSALSTDNVFTNETTDQDSSDVELGVENMKGLLLPSARLFDDLKRSIEVIASVNNISYNNNNSVPYYLLSDMLENKGWEVYDPTLKLDKSAVLEKEVQVLSTSNEKKEETRNYFTNDADVAFYKNLALNSKAVLQKKGTRSSIEIILGLFGFVSKDFSENNYDYEIREYVNICKDNEGVGPISYTGQTKAEMYNLVKNDNNGDEEEPLRGLPVKMVYYENDEGEIYKYLIPWMDKTVDLDGKPYFQMYGGWGKRNEYNYDGNKFTTYSETHKYLPIVERIGELSNITVNHLKKNEVYYVNDVSDFKEYYGVECLTCSNYFILKNVEKSGDYGPNGWVNIPLDDIKVPQKDGLRVVYLNSIIDENRGNNPHTGNGTYDSGEAYRELFKQIFKMDIQNNNFTDDAIDCETGKLKEEIGKIGFTVTHYEDNNKVWYFTDKLKEKKLYSLKKVDVNNYEKNGIRYTLVGEKNNDTSFFYTKSNPYNIEECHFYGSQGENRCIESKQKNTNDVAAAFSVINDKRLVLSFKKPTDEEFTNYLNYCVLPYVMQVIPSTTLLEIELI